MLSLMQVRSKQDVKVRVTETAEGLPVNGK